MRIVERYSHLNGWEHIMVHKPALWQEIEEVIACIDGADFKTKISQEQRMLGRELYNPTTLNARFKQEFVARDWKDTTVSYWVTSDVSLIRKTLTLPPEEQRQEIVDAGGTAIQSYNQTDFVKDRVAIEVQFGKYAFVAFDLFVKHMAFYVRDTIDVGIEILPMKEMQQQMSSGIAYYERELYNVIRQGRGVPAVPLVVLGIAP